MRKLLIALVLLLLLVVVADVFAKQVAEEQIARRLRRTFDLSEEPSVAVGGVPFLLNIVRGEISSIEMTGDRVRSEDVRLDDVEVRIHDVRFSLSQVVDGSGQVRAAGGDGTASISEASLNDALETAGAPFSLNLSDAGVTARSGDAEAAADVSLEGNALSISADGYPAVVLDLPSLGGRVTYDEVSVEEGSAALDFTVQQLEISA